MTSTGEGVIEIPSFRSGVPLRPWLPSEDHTSLSAALALKVASAGPGMRRLLNGEPLATEDVIALGRLNWAAVSMGWEPIVELYRDPVVAPDLAAFLRTLPEKVWRWGTSLA